MKKLGGFLHVLRAAAVLLCTVIVKGVTSLNIYGMAADPNSGIYELPNYAIHLLVLLLTLLAFGSFSRVANNYFNPVTLEQYCYKRRDTDGFIAEHRAIIRSFEFISECVVYLIFGGFLVFMGAFPEVSGSLGTNARAASLPILAVMPLISLNSKYEARRFWLSLKERGELESASRLWRRILNPLLLFIMYPALYPYVPYLLYMIYSMIGIVSELAEWLSVVGLILAVILSVLLIYLLLILRAHRKRSAFIGKLRAAAERSGYSLYDMHSDLRSLTNPSDPRPSFVLEREGKRFVCKLVPTLRRGTHLYLTSSSEGYFRHRLGTKKHHITFRHYIRFPMSDGDLPENGIKLIIVNPIPKNLFLEEYGQTKIVTPGERAWDALIYDGESFLGCLERYCLGKVNNIHD